MRRSRSTVRKIASQQRAFARGKTHHPLSSLRAFLRVVSLLLLVGMRLVQVRNLQTETCPKKRKTRTAPDS